MTDTKIVLAFPGREAFTKKMDDGFYREYPEARACFELAGDAFHQDFAAYCYRAEPVPGLWTGIALAVHCYAVYCVMKNRLSSIAGFVGYSQGEFMACAAAEAAGFLPILNTMVRLEQILQEPPTRRQDMFRIMELDRDTLESCCSEASDSGYVGISAYISGDQHVISGEQPALQQAVRLAKKRGARWVLPLHSYRAYHCPLCSGPQKAAQPHFAALRPEKPAFPLYGCLDGKKSVDGPEILRKLSNQINQPLRWDHLVESLNRDGVTHLWEIGPGCTVSANARVAGGEFSFHWIHTTKDFEDV